LALFLNKEKFVVSEEENRSAALIKALFDHDIKIFNSLLQSNVDANKVGVMVDLR
jgi:hypothetical protein